MPLTIISIIAIILGPILAVQAQVWLDQKRNKKAEKLNISKTLMATRARPMDYDHVRALNMIDVVFNGTNKEEMAITNDKKIYFEHLTNFPTESAENKKTIKAEISEWSERKVDLLVQLLQKIGSYLDYNFDIELIKRGSYCPQGYADFESEQQLLRSQLIDITSGDHPLKIKIEREKL